MSETRLRELSIRDHLTNLYNRRYLEERLELELQRAARKNAHLSVIMLDIDHFKQFNDTFGHAAGDKLLQELSKLFVLNIRSFDNPCRYGGEEFILLLPDASLEGTVSKANELREKVGKMEIFHDNKNLGNVTISLGVAISPEHGNTWEALLKSADSALYRAKNGGRNQVVTANEIT